MAMRGDGVRAGGDWGSILGEIASLEIRENRESSVSTGLAGRLSRSKGERAMDGPKKDSIVFGISAPITDTCLVGRHMLMSVSRPLRSCPEDLAFDCCSTSA